MLFYGYVNKDNKAYVAVYFSMFDVMALQGQGFVKKFIDIFEAKDYNDAMKILNQQVLI